MENDDGETLRRMLGIKLVEAARKAGADLQQPSPPPPPPPAHGEDDDDARR